MMSNTEVTKLMALVKRQEPVALAYPLIIPLLNKSILKNIILEMLKSLFNEK